MSLPKLISGLENHEIWAFDELYSNNKDLVYNTALSYLKDQNDAQEITQDVFVTAVRNIKKFNGDAKIGTWLYRITVNKSLNLLKSSEKYRKAIEIQSDIYKESYQPIDLIDPSNLLESKESKKLLLKAIQNLSTNQRNVITLRFIEELSQLETAEVLGISVAAVESVTQRAKANLKIKLREQTI